MLVVYKTLGQANTTSILLEPVPQEQSNVLTCQQLFCTQGACVNLHITLCKNQEQLGLL